MVVGASLVSEILAPTDAHVCRFFVSPSLMSDHSVSHSLLSLIVPVTKLGNSAQKKCDCEITKFDGASQDRF